jgi:hypothetical protein
LTKQIENECFHGWLFNKTAHEIILFPGKKQLKKAGASLRLPT